MKSCSANFSSNPMIQWLVKPVISIIFSTSMPPTSVPTLTLPTDVNKAFQSVACCVLPLLSEPLGTAVMCDCQIQGDLRQPVKVTMTLGVVSHMSTSPPLPT